MNFTRKQLGRWLIFAAITTSAIPFIELLGSNLSTQELSSWETGWFTKASNESCNFAPGQTQMVVALESNQWSCWVVTPVGSNYRIDTDVNADVCFADDWCDLPLVGRVMPATSKHINDSFTDVGIRRGIFRIIPGGYTNGTATITIEQIDER